MQGCSNFCAYCVVPYTRGPEQSRPSSEILEEVGRLVESGVKEVTLLGQNVNAYGNDLTNGDSFSGLLTRLDGVAGLERIRFTTSHPRDFNEKLAAAMAQLSARVRTYPSSYAKRFRPCAHANEERIHFRRIRQEDKAFEGRSPTCGDNYRRDRRISRGD